MLVFALWQSRAFVSGDSGFQPIAYVHVDAGSFVTIDGVAAFNNPEGCGNATMVMLQSSAGGYNSLYAIVLAAQASGKAIALGDGLRGDALGVHRARCIFGQRQFLAIPQALDAIRFRPRIVDVTPV